MQPSSYVQMSLRVLYATKFLCPNEFGMLYATKFLCPNEFGVLSPPQALMCKRITLVPWHL